MRIVASACLVLAVLFMVGCQQLTDAQKADLGKVSSIEAKANKTAADLDKAINDPAMGLIKKVADIEKFLGDKNSKFGVGQYAPPPAAPTPTGVKPGGTGTPAPTPAPAPAPKPKKPVPSKGPGSTGK
jgi:hypothetical protein